MPQLILPIFVEGESMITHTVSFEKRDGWIYYFQGGMPLFSHAKEDIKSFRMFSSQLIVNGACRQVDIIRAFGVPAISVKRSVKLYREEGAAGFFQKKRNTRKPRVLTSVVLEKAQAMFDDGKSRSQVSESLNIKPDTLYRAVLNGKLIERSVKKNKSERSIEDSETNQGKACTRAIERMAAFTGQIDQATVSFENLCDVKGGGVLFALPALLTNGLLKYSGKFFQLPKGFYSLYNIFLLLGFMALARVKNIERLRYQEPGEWGKILGLDRIPEVRTLREKINLLSNEESVSEWSGAIAKDWMDRDPEAAGVLYVDGHVRVYHGSQTKPPRRYVARQKLALRGVTDYWVNDILGRPFFTISSPFTTGLLDVLENEIVPTLNRDIPGQPTQQKLDNDPYLSRFVLVFDREGYSPDFFLRMWRQRIACQTYHKYPKEKWPENEFKVFQVTMPHGEIIEMELAERGFWLGLKIWVREIRRKCQSGHQTAILSTDYRAEFTKIAIHMFSRWSQENFFKYMMEHYDIDALVGYDLSGTETKHVVNPIYRRLEGQIKSIAGKLGRKKVKFLDIQLMGDDLNPKKVERYEQKKGELWEEIEFLSNELKQLKADRSKTKKHIPFEELPEEDQFHRISPVRKQLLDTVKMIAYRAETAMALLLRENLGRKDDVRPLLREIYNSDVDLCPDEENKTLLVKLHRLANPQSDWAVKILCDQLNESETIYPGSEFKLVFELVSN